MSELKEPSVYREPSANKEPFTPWYREPWAWYIVGILVVTFAWGGVQVYTAFTHQDSVVIDDYYQYGKTINADLTRENNARSLGIAGTLTIDELIGEVRVMLAGNPGEWPQVLQLKFLSPVFADQDKAIQLRRSVSSAITSSATTSPETSPVYVGQLDEILSGRYYLQLETEDQFIPEVGYESGWKISLEAQVTPGTSIKLQNPDV